MTDRKNSMYAYDVDVVADAIKDIQKLDDAYIYAATITVMREDGESLAEVWWDSESETWRVDWNTNESN